MPRIEADHTQDKPPRQRNRRGEGHLLRDEIVTAATAMLEQTGSEEAITLRAIARAIGVTPPSVSLHFVDREAVIDAVVAVELLRLDSIISDTATAHADPVERYLEMARAYVRFGRENPGCYRVLFERRYLPAWEAQARPMANTAPVFARVFETILKTLEDCVASGRSASTDPVEDTVGVWYFLHGLVALPATITSFAWPEFDTHLDKGVIRMAQLTRPKAKPRTTKKH